MNAPKTSPDQGGNPPDNGIIDLTDPIPSPFEDDVPIIELTDRVNVPDSSPAGRSPAPGIAGAPADEEPLERLPGLEADRIPIDLLDDAIILEDRLDATEEVDDFVDSLGIEIEPAASPDTGPTGMALERGTPGAKDQPPARALDSLAASSLSAETVEAALERVIEKIWADRIEGILVETVERVVKREIEEIRATLMEDPEE